MTVVRIDGQPNPIPFHWQAGTKSMERSVILRHGVLLLPAMTTTEADSGDCVIKIKALSNGVTL